MRRGTAIAGLGIVLALYLLRAASCWSPDAFGYLHDDTLYVGSARSLAEGSGYRIPSLPGAPPQTKYPVLYPWLLSWLWRGWPDLGAVLRGALILNSLCGCLFLGGAFFLVRQLGAGTLAALLITLVCSLHPILIDLARVPLSDLAFMALAVWALGSAGRVLERGNPARWPRWAAAMALGASAVATRSIGLAVVAGVFLASTLSGFHRQAWTYAACAVPFLAMLGWAGLAAPESADSAGFEGYRQTLLYYTSYISFWKLSVPDVATLLAQLQFNLVELLKAPAMLCFHLPVWGFQGGLWQAVAIAISFLIVKGAFRGPSHRDRPRGCHAVHFSLLGHVPIVLLWNYTLMERLLLLFLPLFLWGAAVEGEQIVRQAQDAWRQRAPGAQRVAAGLITAAIAVLAVYGAYRALWVIPGYTSAQNTRRSALAAHKQAAYEWIRGHTESADRFVAYEDGLLFLHTGRTAMRPIATTTAAFYQQDMAPLERDLAHLGDTAAAIGARYWVVAENDYHLESASEFLQEATGDLLSDYPAVFESGDAVRIHDLSQPLETSH